MGERSPCIIQCDEGKRCGPYKAKLMYAAVYNFGPRWLKVDLGAKEQFDDPGPSRLISGTPVLLNEVKEAIVKYISENNPTITEVQELSHRLSTVTNSEQLEKILYENANCTPIIFGKAQGGVTSSFGERGFVPEIHRSVVLCGLSKSARQHVARNNIEVLVSHSRALVRTQRLSFVPAIQDYLISPIFQKVVQGDRIRTRCTWLGQIKRTLCCRCRRRRRH